MIRSYKNCFFLHFSLINIEHVRNHIQYNHIMYEFFLSHFSTVNTATFEKELFKRQQGMTSITKTLKRVRFDGDLLISSQKYFDDINRIFNSNETYVSYVNPDAEKEDNRDYVIISQLFEVDGIRYTGIQKSRGVGVHGMHMFARNKGINLDADEWMQFEDHFPKLRQLFTVKTGRKEDMVRVLKEAVKEANE